MYLKDRYNRFLGTSENRSVPTFQELIYYFLFYYYTLYFEFTDASLLGDVYVWVFLKSPLREVQTPRSPILSNLVSSI